MAAPIPAETAAVGKTGSNFKPFRWAYREKRILRDLLFVEDEPRFDVAEPGAYYACIVCDKWANGVSSTLSEEHC